MQPIPSQNAPSSASQKQNSGCADQIALFIVVAYMVGFTALGQTSAWSADELIFEGLIHPPFYSRALLALGFASIVWFPLVLLTRFWKTSRYHPFYRTWAFAASFNLLMAAARLFPNTSVQASTALHVVLMLLFCLLLGLWIRRSGSGSPQLRDSASPAGWLGLAAGVIIGLPWVAWGALGSPLDSLLALLEGLFFGISAVLIVFFTLIQPLQQNLSRDRSEIFMSGFGALIALALMAFGLQINGFEGYLFSVVLGLVIPWFVLVMFTGLGWFTSSILIGVGTALPLMFVDPDELSMIISSGQGELLQWVNQASAISVVLGLLVAVGIYAFRQKMISGLQSRTAVFGTVLVLLIAGILYGTIGRAGFFGERLFVIMKSQADLSSAPAMTDYNQRREFVYHTLVDTAQQSQARLRQSLDRYHVTYKPYYLENGMEVWGGPLVRAWLAAQPDVDRILDNPELRPLPEPVPEAKGSAPAPEGIAWNQKMIGADRVWNELGVTGKGIVIGQSDSGVQGDHPDLAGNYRGKTSGGDYNWIDPWNHSTSPVDIGGHGTHTLGIMAGTRTGIAPGATWFGCVNLARNLGNPSLYLDCMQFMLAPYPQKGDPFKDGDPTRSANVINNSWGCPDVEGCDPDALLPAVNALRAAGIFVVVSAGNNGYVGCGTVTDPLAIYSSAFTVGAVDPNGNLAAFSSLGPVKVDGSGRIKPDIVAPGDQVVSTFPNNSYQTESGTSMAGPHVVGVVALMWSANPKLIGNIDLTQSILDETAQAYRGNLPACVDGKQKPNDGVGWGLVDAYSAVKRAQQAK